jgi:hypothetical protein
VNQAHVSLTEDVFPGIGQPLKPVYFGRDHPYYMPENIFDDFNSSLAIINKWKSMHNGESNLHLLLYAITNKYISVVGSSVLIDKDAPRVKRIKPNGDVAAMEPFWPWEPRADGKEIYAIRGFHQMHCIVRATLIRNSRPVYGNKEPDCLC